MNITMQDLPGLRNDLANLQPSEITPNQNRPLSKRQVVLQLADTLLALKKKGLTYKDLSIVLEQRETQIFPATIAQYLSEVAPKKTKPNAKQKSKQVAKSKRGKLPEMMSPTPYSSPP